MAVNGISIENSDETLAGSDESVFLLGEDTDDFEKATADDDDVLFVEDEIEKNVEESDNDFLDGLGMREYNKNTGELTSTEKHFIKKKTGWSNDVIDYIRSIKEAEIYIEANLKETEINGRKCLIRDDINLEQTDENGITNKEKMAQGKSPIAKNGEEVQLHHIGQKVDSPLAEITVSEHVKKGNNTILHNLKMKSEINRSEFNFYRKTHWKIRSEQRRLKNG